MQIIKLEENAFDVICGAELNIGDIRYAVEYQGEIYYFCKQSCKDYFAMAPSLYIGDLSKFLHQNGSQELAK